MHFFVLRHLGRLSLQMRSTKVGPVLQELPHLVASSRHREGFSYQQQTDEGQETVPECRLVLVLEHLRLEQLQDPQDMDEEGQVVLLPEFLEIEVNAAVQQCCNHWQVPETPNKKIRPRSFKGTWYLSSWKAKSLILSLSSCLHPCTDRFSMPHFPPILSSLVSNSKIIS